MVVKNETKTVRSVHYTLTDEETQSLIVSARIVESLFKNKIFKLEDDWNVVDYLDVIDFLMLISKHSGEKFTIED